MPLELTTPYFTIRFGVSEFSAALKTIRLAVNEYSSPAALRLYSDEAKTLEIGRREDTITETPGTMLVMSEAPNEIYISGYKRLDAKINGRVVLLSQAVSADEPVTAYIGNPVKLYRTSQAVETSILYTGDTISEPLVILSENAYTGLKGDIEISLDGLNFAYSIEGIIGANIYVKPNTITALKTAPENSISEQLAVVYIDRATAGDLQATFSSSGYLDYIISSHDAEICGVEYVDADDQIAAVYGTSGTITDAKLGHSGIFKAFTEVDLVRTYVGEIRTSRVGSIPVIVKTSGFNSKNFNVLSHSLNIIPGVNPVMTA